MRALLLACLLVVAAVPVLADKVSEDPLERRMLEIAKDLRCAVCQNQPVSESNAPLAQDMRAIIRDQLKAGKSPEEIKRYFVDRYGDYVLMKPATRGFGAIVWLGPVLLFVVIAIGGLVFLRRRLRTSLPMPAALSAEDRERIERARREDRGP